jgi:sugar-specific transcriptional regulator TrmB
MQKKRFIQTLLDWGLSENEAAVYFSALSLGKTTVSSIASDSGVKRTSIYSIYESLKQKGLMSVEVQGFKQVYVAESPETLKRIIETKKQEFEDLLPDFLRVYNVGGKSDTIKYYEGVKSVRSVYDLLLSDLRPGDDYLVISNDEEWYALDPEYYEKFIERRGKMRLNVQLLLQDTEAGRRFKKFEKNYNTSVKLLPCKTQLHTTLVVTKNRVVVQQLAFPIIALVIENKSIIQMHQQLFGIIWDSIME